MIKFAIAAETARCAEVHINGSRDLNTVAHIAVESATEVVEYLTVPPRSGWVYDMDRGRWSRRGIRYYIVYHVDSDGTWHNPERYEI